MALTYPVNLNLRYIAYSKSLQQLVGEPFSWPRADGMPLKNADPDLVFGYIEQNPPPIYNSATHKLVETKTLNKAEGKLVLGYMVVLLTPEEKAIRDEEIANEVLVGKIKDAIVDLKAGTGTSLERLVRLETAVAYLLKQILP